jgi:tetratricopeptide (TPR) repeat protein
LELVDAVTRVTDDIDGTALAVRVGVLTGEASVAPATPDRGLVVGDLVNTAARLQSIAEPGTVVVGESAYRMLRDVVQFEPLGEHVLKGKAEPTPAWRAVRVKSDRTQRSVSGGWESPFVGREEELRLLKDALHATERTRRSRLVSIIGEAGMGKTRLAWELRKYVGGLADDIYWHDGRSPAYDQGLTFWALGEMVRLRAGIAETEDAHRSRTKLRTAVADYVPSPADQEWLEPRLAALLGLERTSTGEQSEFFSAVRSFFQHISERGPTVLVFEDFHWADAGLVEFVRDLVERSPRHPILVLTLARPDLLDRFPGWGSGRRNFTSAHLGPLTDPEMAVLVTGLVADIGEELVEAIAQRASGIPLYAIELIRMLLAEGALEMDDDACCIPTGDLSSIRVPDTVRAVVAARLDRLSTDARSLLQDAAVLGAAFTPAGLGAMSGLETAEVERRLEPLVHRELLEFESDPRSPERGQYRFVQSMIREVAYGRLTRDERRVRHTRAAEFFAELGEVELAGAAASHFLAAQRVTPNPDDAQVLAGKATAALAEAADHAARVHSHTDGLRMIEQALANTADPAIEATLLQRAARSASALAQHDTAIDYACQALEWHRRQGDRTAVVEAAGLVGDVFCSAYKPLEAIKVLEPVLEAEAALAEPAAVTAAAKLARAYLMALRDTDAAGLAERVIGPAERLDLIPTIVDTLITRGTALGNLGRMHEAIAILHGATRFAEDNDLPVAQMRAANNAGHLLAFDDHSGAMKVCQIGMKLANRLGDVRFAASFTWAVAAYLERDGRFDEARELRDEVRDRFELPAGSLEWYELTDLMARVECGDESALDPAYAAVQLAVDEANPQSEAGVAATRAKLDIFAGRFDAAFEGIMAVATAQRYPDQLAVAAVAAALLGDVGRLEHLAAEVESSPARGRLLGSVAATVSGALAALRGHTDEAVAAFSSALAFRHLRLDRANLQALFATLVGRDNPEARQASDAAFALFSEVGAEAYLDLYANGMPPLEERRAAGA